jgi:cyclase
MSQTVLAQYLPLPAQIDISGEWGSRVYKDFLARGPGPELGDYTGLPLNDAGRLRAQSWDESELSAPEEQPVPHPACYSMWGPGTNLRIQKIFDPRDSALQGYTITGLYGRADRTIWLDGRQSPSAFSENTWTGFSVGKAEQNQLVVTTTQMKDGYIQRNGAACSDRAKMTEYFVRHGDLLIDMSFIDDPAYLEEPMVRTMDWVLTPDLGVDNRVSFQAAEEVADRPDDYVPHYPLGTQHSEFAKQSGIPFEATQGGSRTLYPDYLPRLRAMIAGEKPTPDPWIVPGTVSGLPSAGDQGPYGLPPAFDAAGVQIVPVRKSLYMLVVDGQNVVAQVGPDGVLLVDTGPTNAAAQLLSSVKSLSDGKIQFVVDTDFTDDVVGGVAAVVEAGGDPVTASEYGALRGTVGSGTTVVAQNQVAFHLATQSPPAPRAGQPGIQFTSYRALVFNGEPIEIWGIPAATDDANSVAFFRKADVIAAGNLLDTTRYPRIDAANGGTIEGVIDGLTRVIKAAVPGRNSTGGTVVIPGHGHLCNQIDVVYYRNMLVVIRDRVRDMVRKGMTQPRVLAADPTADYEGLYGSKTGKWTTEMFVSAIFQHEQASLRHKK